MDELDTASELIRDRESLPLCTRIIDISKKDTISDDDINELVALSECNKDRKYFSNLFGIYVSDLAIALLKCIGDENYYELYNKQDEWQKKRILEIANSDFFNNNAV